jgi:L-alanine-DL-glutamate epimerase-like enolase superfamily enzyme
MSVPVAGAAEVAARVREGKRAGFRTFKLKLNGREPEIANLSRIRSAHRASPRARLLLDPNQSYGAQGLSSLLEAIRRDGLPVDLVEEPFPKRDWKTLAAFRGKSGLPILLDESVQTPSDARRAVRGRLAQGVNVKLAKSGPSKGKVIVDVFGRRRSPLMIGCMAESPLGLAASIQFAMGLGVFDHADLDSDLLLEAVPVQGGYLRRGPEIILPKVPAAGLGVGLR